MPSTTPELNREYQRQYRARMTAERKKEFDKQRYLRTKDKYRERGKIWRVRNIEAAQASGHQTQVRTNYPAIFTRSSITNKQLTEWLKDNRGTPCRYCAEEATHIDHKIPLSRNGNHSFDNIQILCKRCNLGKHDMTEEEFINHIKKILRHTIEL